MWRAVWKCAACAGCAAMCRMFVLDAAMRRRACMCGSSVRPCEAVCGGVLAVCGSCVYVRAGTRASSPRNPPSPAGAPGAARAHDRPAAPHPSQTARRPAGQPTPQTPTASRSCCASLRVDFLRGGGDGGGGRRRRPADCRSVRPHAFPRRRRGPRRRLGCSAPP